MLETIAALSPKLCDPSSRRETSTALTTLSTLPLSCWTGTSSGTSDRKRKTSGDPCWNPPTALPIPSATGLTCKNWVARGRIPHLTFQSLPTEKPTQPESDRTSLQQTVQCLFQPTNNIGPSEGFWGTSPPPTQSGSLIQAVRWERRRSGH